MSTRATGFPVEYRGPLTTLWVEFDGVPAWVLAAGPAAAGPQGVLLYPVNPEAPPIRVRGPIGPEHVTYTGDGVPQLDTTNAAEVLPDRFEIEGSLVRFHFDTPVREGTYRVLVHESRFRMVTDETKATLVSEAGAPWDGWTFAVVAGPQPEVAPKPLDLAQGMAVQPAHAASRPVDRVQVRLDGNVLPVGSSELSGEVLTVVGPESIVRSVSLRVEGLLTSGGSFYERHLVRTLATFERPQADGGGTVHAVHFTSAGHLNQTAFAVYHGRETEGRIPLNAAGEFANGVPVLRAPRPTDPLVSSEVEAVPLRLNTYTVATTTVTPRLPAARALLPVYTARPVVSPFAIIDVEDTPVADPLVLSEIAADAVYDTAPGEPSVFATLDLPVNARLRLVYTDAYGDEHELWWGQTRLLPLLITAAQYARETGQAGLPPAAVADIRRLIWTASLEAIQLWSCLLPDVANQTMVQYVLTRLAYGWPRNNEFSGAFMAKMGEHTVSGEVDTRIEQRLRGLANLLETCVGTPPLFAEDEEEYFASTARVASTAYPEYHPGGRRALQHVPVYTNGFVPDGMGGSIDEIYGHGASRYFFSSEEPPAAARPRY